jgi:uncharacterized protein HemX
MLRCHLSGLLIVAILIIATAPLYAQRQQQNVAKLKSDARNVVGAIGADKDKTKTYCQILDLERQMNQAARKEQKKARTLVQELQKQLGPELVTLGNILKHVDLNSPDGREIAAIIQSLNHSCPE